MSDVVPMNDYFNRLLAAQRMLGGITAARDLVHHHVGNGAQIIASTMSHQGRDRSAVSAFITKAADINEAARQQASKAIREIMEDAMGLELLSYNMATMLSAGDLPLKTRYVAIGEFAKRMRKEKPLLEKALDDIRMKAEERLLKAAGMWPNGLTINS